MLEQEQNKDLNPQEGSAQEYSKDLDPQQGQAQEDSQDVAMQQGAAQVHSQDLNPQQGAAQKHTIESILNQGEGHAKDSTPKWSDEKWESEKESKKEKLNKLKPGKDEAYLLIICLLLIASGPMGIGIAAGLAGGYAALKAVDIKRFVDKAKKIKNQRELSNQKDKKENTIEKENEEIALEKDEKIDVNPEESLETSASKSNVLEESKTLSDYYKQEVDLEETLSHLDDDTLNRISNMTEQEIIDKGLDLGKDGESRKIFEKLLALKRELSAKTNAQNVVAPENELEGKSLNAKLNKLINVSNQPNNVHIPAGPSPKEIKTIDDSLENERKGLDNHQDNKKESVQYAELSVNTGNNQKNIERHNIQFPPQTENDRVTQEQHKITKNSSNDVSKSLSMLLHPQVKLTEAGSSFRMKERLQKSTNTKREQTRTNIQRRGKR